MSQNRRLAALLAVLALGLGAGGCTLAKPIVGAVTGPVYALVALGESGSCGCHDGRALCLYFAGASIVGAGAGFVTGVISDVQVLRGRAEDPTRNWWNPFVINTAAEQR